MEGEETKIVQKDQEETKKKFFPVPRARGEEDLNVCELLHRAYSAGPVSPPCFDVYGRKLLRAATLDDTTPQLRLCA